MKAIKISVSLFEYLTQHETLLGRIHSVFDGAFNVIDDNNRLIGILSARKELGPLSMQVNKDTFHMLGLEQGQLIKFEDDCLHFDKNKYKIIYKDCPVESLSLKPMPIQVGANLRLKLNLLKDLILEFGSQSGIAPLIDHVSFDHKLSYYPEGKELNEYSDFIQERLIGLLEDLNQGISIDAFKSLEKIIGFGPGLTPSADDFISGILSVLIVNGQLEDVLKAHILELINNKTTRISEEMLHHTLNGEVSESYKYFIEALFDDKNKDISNESKDVIHIGSTSGTDYLFGVYCMASLITIKEASNDQI
jgi:hypothetical protein